MAAPRTRESRATLDYRIGFIAESNIHEQALFAPSQLRLVPRAKRVALATFSSYQLDSQKCQDFFEKNEPHGNGDVASSGNGRRAAEYPGSGGDSPVVALAFLGGRPSNSPAHAASTASGFPAVWRWKGKTRTRQKPALTQSSDLQPDVGVNRPREAPVENGQGRNGQAKQNQHL